MKHVNRVCGKLDECQFDVMQFHDLTMYRMYKNLIYSS